MLYDLKNEYDVQGARDYLRSLVEDGAMIEIRRKQVRHTTPQQRYLHLLIGFFALEYGIGMEECKIDFYKRTCNPDLYEREMTNKNGKVVKYLRSSNDLTKDEYALSITRFRNWASSEAGIYLPDADDYRFLFHIEKEIARNKEYL